MWAEELRVVTPSTLYERALSFVRGPTFVYLAGSVLGRVGAILLVPLYTNRLGPEQYGAYGLAASLLGLFPVLLSLGLNAGMGLTFFEAPTPAEGVKRLASLGRGLTVVGVPIAALLIAALFALVPEGWGHLSLTNLVLLVFAGLFSSFAVVPDTAFRLSQRAWPAVSLQLAQFLTTTLGGLLLVAYLGRGLDGAIEAAAMTAMLAGTYGLYYAFLATRTTFSTALFRRSMAISVAFVPHALASWAQDAGDRWILARFGSPSELGPYYLTAQLTAPIALAISAWNSSESPRVGEIYRGGGVAALATTAKSQYARFAGSALIPYVTLLALSPLLPCLISEKFFNTVWLLPFVGGAVVIDSLYYPSANVLFYSGRPRAIPLVTFLSATLGLVVSFLLLKVFGLWGLVAARIVASACRSGGLFIAARLVIGTELERPSHVEDSLSSSLRVGRH